MLHGPPGGLAHRVGGRDVHLCEGASQSFILEEVIDVRIDVLAARVSHDHGSLGSALQLVRRVMREPTRPDTAETIFGLAG